MAIFKLIVNGRECVTDPNTYFELIRGSVVGREVGAANREYSTNIDLPNVEQNATIFRAHVLWGGTSEVMHGIASYGREAFEVFVQLVSFDKKKITVYLVQSSTRFNELYGLSYKELLVKAGISEYTITNVAGAHAAAFAANAAEIGISSLYSPKTVAQLLSDASLSGIIDMGGVNTVKILQTRSKGTFKPFISVFEKNSYEIPEGPTNRCTNEFIAGLNMGGASPGITEGMDDLRFYAPPALHPMPEVYKQLFVKIEWIGATDAFTTPRPRFWVEKYDGLGGLDDKFYVNPTSGATSSGVLTLHHNGPTLFYLYREGTPLVSATVRVTIMGWVCVSSDTPEGYGYEPTLAGTGDINLIHLIKMLGIERGKYLTISGNKLKFADLPSLDELNIINLSKHYLSCKGVKIGSKNPLKALNNYVQYSPNEAGNFGRINIKIDEPKGKVLPSEDVIMTLPFTDFGRIYDNRHNINVLSTNEPNALQANVEAFRIYRDTFNDTTLYSIEFEGLETVPEQLIYIEQLNGLFLAEKIIKTSNGRLIVDCFKVKKQ